MCYVYFHAKRINKLKMASSPSLPPSLPPFPFQQLVSVDLYVILQFLPIVLTQLFRILSTSKELEQLKAVVVR